MELAGSQPSSRSQGTKVERDRAGSLRFSSFSTPASPRACANTTHKRVRTRTHVHTHPPTHSVTLTNCDSSLPMLAFPFHFHHAMTLLPNAINTPLMFAGSGTGRQEQILSFMNSATENRTHRSMIATCALCQLLGIHEAGKRSTAVDQEKREAGLCT